MHLKPAAVGVETAYSGGAGTRMPNTAAVLTGDRNSGSEAGTDPPSVGRVPSPTGYFDGMPGRVLGGPTTHRQPHARSFSDTEEKSHPQQSTAARLYREREAIEERRAWAQRRTSTTKRRPPASSSSPPPPFAGGILKRSPQATAAIPPSAGLKPGRRSGNDWGGGVGGRNAEEVPPARRRGREKQSPGGGGGTTEAAASGGKNNQSDAEEDAVSRAFRRYAEDRDLDRGRSRDRNLANRDSDNRGGGGLLSQQAPPPHTPPSASLSPPQRLGSLRRQGEKQEGCGDDHSLSRRQRRREQRSVPQEDQDTARLYFGERGSDQGDSSSGEVVVDAVGISGGDEGGGRARLFGAADFGRGRKASLERYSRRSERGGGWKGDGDGGRDGDTRKDEEEVVDELERDRALRQAFDMYDLNGDGFITYLEVRT